MEYFNSDVLSVIVNHVEQPKSFRSLFLTCRLFAQECRKQMSKKRVEFMINVTKKSDKKTSTYTVLPNGLKDGWKHTVVNEPNKNIVIRTYYKNGKRNGFREQWECVSNDTYYLTQRSEYVDGLLEGVTEMWQINDNNERIRSGTLPYLHGILHGKSAIFVNGMLVQELEYSNGLPKIVITRCKAISKGKQCKKRVTNGKYCFRHLAKNA